LRVTLDSNAIIDLEEQRPAAPALRALIALYRAGAFCLCVSNIVAGERDRNGAAEPNYGNFTAKLARTNLADVELLHPPAHWGITFFDQSIWPELNDTLQPAIQSILFPKLKDHFASVPGESDNERTKRIHKGNNQLCDVLGMWCHIRYKGDVFVTSDRNFHKQRKKLLLVGLGAGHILTPDDAVPYVLKLNP
jgi:hypothetical protein